MLVVANVINIAADLGGMADSTEMVTGVNSLVLDSILYSFDRRILILVVLPANCADLQVDHAGTAGLCRDRILCPS